MLDIRWFAPNRYCTLPVGRLRDGGLQIATEGDEPARLVVASDGASAIAAQRFAWRHRAPMLVYLWDLPPWQLAGGRPNLVIPFRGQVLKVPRLWGGYPERNGYYSRLRYVARHAVQVWAPSANSREVIRQEFKVAVERVPFCFDTDRFYRAAGWRPPTGIASPLVLSISRLVRYKNHAAVIRAAALMAPTPRVRILGKGPEAAPLRRLAVELGVDLQLDEGWQSDQQIVDAYLAANVVVCPSRFEGIGLTPLESAAMGIPTVASDIPTHREFAAKHVVLISLDDDQLMAHSIARALEKATAPSVTPSHPMPELTIEACADRFLPRLEELLRGKG